MRNWSSALWPASWNGFPFYVETEGRPAMRRIVAHELPMCDTPFLQDLGQGARKLTVDAYLASDTADLDALALEALLTEGGSGQLVLPTGGPIMARPLEWHPQYKLSQHGMMGFTITFYEDLGGSAVSIGDFLGATVFALTEGLGPIAAAFAGALQIVGTVGAVINAALDAYQSAVATLALIASTEAMDPTIASQVTIAGTALMAQAEAGFTAAALDSTLGQALVDYARLIGDGLSSDDAAAAFGALADAAPVTGLAGTAAPLAAATPWNGTIAQQASARNSARIGILLRMAVIAAYAEAIGRQSFASRPAGLTARGLWAERSDLALQEAAGGEAVDVFEAVAQLQGAVIDFLSTEITTLAPVVTVTAPLSLPALVHAWRLYADPTRADELVARNDVVHPLFMPMSFEALAT